VVNLPSFLFLEFGYPDFEQRWPNGAFIFTVAIWFADSFEFGVPGW
jgi:hypothetical protein